MYDKIGGGSSIHVSSPPIKGGSENVVYILWGNPPKQPDLMVGDHVSSIDEGFTTAR